MKFHKVYFVIAVIIFIIEVLIALFAHDKIIRPYVGDVLVVILLYCFVKSFFDLPVKATSLAVLVFAYFIETLQYFHLIEKLGLEKSKLAHLILGTHFTWIDIIAYTIGILLVIFTEIYFKKSGRKLT